MFKRDGKVKTPKTPEQMKKGKKRKKISFPGICKKGICAGGEEKAGGRTERSRKGRVYNQMQGDSIL